MTAEEIERLLIDSMSRDKLVRVKARNGREITGTVTGFTARKGTHVGVWITEAAGFKFCRPIESSSDPKDFSASDIVEACILEEKTT